MLGGEERERERGETLAQRIEPGGIVAEASKLAGRRVLGLHEHAEVAQAVAAQKIANREAVGLQSQRGQAPRRDGLEDVLGAEVAQELGLGKEDNG